MGVPYRKERLQEDDTVPLFLFNQMKHFHLPPKDPDIIMVRSGTGIAPFRSFIELRRKTKAMGKSWLFFGDQHAATDFLYKKTSQNNINLRQY